MTADPYQHGGYDDDRGDVDTCRHGLEECERCEADREHLLRKAVDLAAAYTIRDGGPPCPVCGTENVAWFASLFGACPDCGARVKAVAS